VQSLDPIYVNFGVPQQDAGRIRVGHAVRITARDLPEVDFAGRVTAVDSTVDQSTRNVQVQATLANQGCKLRPGMFVQAELLLGSDRAVLALPASAVNYAPFGDSVFVVTDLKGENGQSYRGARQQFVKLGGARGDQVAILTGVAPGDEIVTSGVFRLRNGAAVVVNNKVQPGNKRAPKPEDS
jgi:membrane fusion protein (multidrug efflux system)